METQGCSCPETQGCKDPCKNDAPCESCAKSEEPKKLVSVTGSEVAIKSEYFAVLRYGKDRKAIATDIVLDLPDLEPEIMDTMMMFDLPEDTEVKRVMRTTIDREVKWEG